MARGNTPVTTSDPVTGTGVVKSPNSCWRFMQGSYCPEELCHYQHGPPLHGTRLPRRTAASYGRTACLYFAQGYCKYGEKCAFAHIPLTNGPQSTTPIDETTRDSWIAPPTQNSKDATSRVHRLPPQQDPTTWVPVENFEYPAGYIPTNQGHSVVWGDQDEGDEMENSPTAMQYLDKSRSRQVYDDKKVLVLSGGVMLGRPDQPHVPSQSPFNSSVPTIRPPSQPLQIVPPPIPTGTVPSLHSSASSFSSGEYLPSPLDAYEAQVMPSYAPVPPPTPWTFGYPPQQTTITMKPARPPTSHHRSKRERYAQPVPLSQPASSDRAPSPAFDADLESKLSALQLDPSAKTDGYASDEAAPARRVPAPKNSFPASTPSTPFRRSSLSAVAELNGNRRDVSGAILREPHATHRRGRPSM